MDYWCIKCESCFENDTPTCRKCDSTNVVNIIDLNTTMGELINLKKISQDKTFIQSMLNLKKSDPIEYQLKLSQFKAQLAQQESVKAKTDNQVKCAYCNSTNVKKISGLSKAGSVAMWGIFSKKVHKEWHCNSCGSDF